MDSLGSLLLTAAGQMGLRFSRDMPGGVRETAERLARQQAKGWPMSKSIHYTCGHAKHARRIARQQRGKAERRAARA